MITINFGLAFACAFFAILAWLFKSVFPIPWAWVKTTGYVLSLLASVYYGVLFFWFLFPHP